ncbi:MAG: hypothetical protein WD360_03970 [Nitriliruptoraceae bacterium]
MVTRRRARPPRTSVRARMIAFALGLITIIAVYTWLRSPGMIAVGSDNDEYQLVAKALARFDAPIVAGVEGTKYPLLYPALLALMLVGRIPLHGGAVVLNLAAALTAAGSVAWLVGRARRGAPVSFAAGFAAATVLLASRAVWNDMFSTMPEMLLLATIALMLVVIDRDDSANRTVILTVLAVVAVGFKTLALPFMLGGFGILWLYDRQVKTLIPAITAAVTALIGMLWMRSYPSHTTGYVETFFLIDPDDAAEGNISFLGVIERTLAQIPDALRDLGQAFISLSMSRSITITVALILLVIGVQASRKLGKNPALGRFAFGATIAYTLAMALWPYNAPRFGLPLLPIAALGIGWMLRGAGRWLGERDALVFISAAAVAALLATSITAVRDDGADARNIISEQHASRDAVANWLATNAPDAKLVSFDYREIANRTDETVHPIGYTSDPAALRKQLGDADMLVVMRYYGKRNRQAQVLLDTYPELFTELFSVSRGTVYLIND